MNLQQFLEKLEQKIITFYPMLSENNNSEKVNGAIISAHNMKNNTFVNILNYEEVAQFNEIVNLILSYSNISERFSVEYIRNQIIKLFHKILLDSSDIHADLQNFYSNLRKDFNDEWFVISEIENIRLLDTGPFQLINSTIKVLVESDLPADVDLKRGDVFHFSDYIGKPCIYTNVKAGDSEKARILAVNNFTISFNLLRLYATNFKPAIKGTLVSGRQNISEHNISKKVSGESLTIIGDVLLNRAYLNNNLYTSLEKEGINNLSNNNSISKIIKESLHWFGIGLDEEMPSAKLLNFVTVLESVLKKNDEITELKQRISDRCALFLGNDFDTRIKIVNEISTIYKVRSKVVHKGVIIGDQNIAELAGSYARSILIKLIQENERLNGDFSEFINELDNKKFK